MATMSHSDFKCPIGKGSVESGDYVPLLSYDMNAGNE